MKNIFIGFLMTFFVIFSTSAQEGKLLSVDEELSSSKINHIYQDSDGIIWIATEDGLNRYDGTRLTVFRNIPDKTNSLINNYVRLLFEDSKNDFYIGTLSGLQKYDRARETFSEVYFPSQIKVRPNITTIIERHNGDIIFGTAGAGSFRIDQRNDSLVATPLFLLPQYIQSRIFEDSHQRLWIITNKSAIYQINKDSKIREYTFNEDKIWLTCITEDCRGNIFVGCLKNGLLEFDEKNDRFNKVISREYPELPVKTLYPDKEGKMLVGTDGCGLKEYDCELKKITDSPYSSQNFDLQQSKVHTILKDNKNNLWLGLFQKGVFIFPASANNFRYIGNKSRSVDLIGNCYISAIHKAHDNTLWVGTDNDGIYSISSGKSRHYAHTDSKNTVPATVMSIFEDSNRDLWVGSFRDGLACLNKTTGKCEYIRNLPDRWANNVQSIYCMTEDKEKNLWIGTMGSGLYRLNLQTRKIRWFQASTNRPEHSENVLPQAWINCLLYSRDRLFIGTYDGLSCLNLNDESFTSEFNSNKILDGDVIYAICLDKDENLWVGTSKGLKYFNMTTFETKEYTVAEGLPNNSISGLVCDSIGNIWISTNYGISCYSAKEKSFTNYFRSDGIQGNEFSKGSSFKDTQGYIYFGGNNGITYFNPLEIKTPDKKPEIRISDFYIHDTSVKLGSMSGQYQIIDTSVSKASKFELSHSDNSFSIGFSAMDLYNPEHITYMYSFAGNEWVSLQQGINKVSFSELSPGRYSFKVKAKDYSAISPEKEIFIIIHPAWYASNWAIIVYILCCIIIIMLILLQIRHRYRIRQQLLQQSHQEEINEAKLQFFINISHEIRTPMSLITGPLQQLISTDNDAERQNTYSMIYRNTQRILSLINQLMDIRKIDKGQMRLKFSATDISGFIKDIWRNFEYQAKSKKITINFDFPDSLPLVWIDPKNFDKVLMNLFSNAVKFTPENGEINISITLSQSIKIIIEDSGIGLDKQEIGRIFDRFYQIHNSMNNSNIGTGIGLHLSKSLVLLHHGEIKAENNISKPGSRFIITLPLGNAHLQAEEMETEEPVTVTAPELSIMQDTFSSKKKYSKSKHHILVVEDDQEISNYISSQFAPYFHVHIAANGKEALSYILKESVELVISDVMMPEMDGITLCRKIRQNININHIPVILLTAKVRESDNLEGLNAGADVYITKPFNIEILHQNAENLIRSREQLKNSFLGNQLQPDKIQKVELDSPDDRLLKRITKVINENISNPELNVEMITREVGISRVHLHRKLKELTNQSTRDFIRNIRLSQAAELLSQKKLNISEVALNVGFNNVTYFSTAFKEMYGVSPTSYMENSSNTTAAE